MDGTEGLWGKVKKDEAGGATQVKNAGVREGCTPQRIEYRRNFLACPPVSMSDEAF